MASSSNFMAGSLSREVQEHQQTQNAAAAARFSQLNLDTLPETPPPCPLVEDRTQDFDDIEGFPTNDLKISDFREIKALGKGSFGQVYAVEPLLPSNHPLQTRPRYAIKQVILSRNFDRSVRQVKESQNEREAMNLLKGGRFIVQLHATFRKEDRLFFLMDHCGAELLRMLLTKKELPSQQTAWLWIAQLYTALSFCHSQGVVHRDVKPSNIVLSAVQGHVRLVDFGLAIPKPNFETMKRGAGCRKFMPPENIIFRSYRVRSDPLGYEMDWWTLGATAYYIITAQYAYENALNVPIELSYDIREGFSRSEEPDRAFRDMVSGCLSRDLADRARAVRECPMLRPENIRLQGCPDAYLKGMIAHMKIKRHQTVLKKKAKKISSIES